MIHNFASEINCLNVEVEIRDSSASLDTYMPQ